jgi:hypothetical protein
MPPSRNQLSRRFKAPAPPRSADANNVSTKNGVPPNQVWSPGTDQFENPGDTSSFTDQGTDTTPMGTKVKTSTKQPAPAGTRPMNVTASRPLPKGIAKTATAKVALPKAPGLNQNLSRVAHPRPVATSLNQSVKPVMPSAKNVAQTISMQKTRNMRGAGANSAFYGDFGV